MDITVNEKWGCPLRQHTSLELVAPPSSGVIGFGLRPNVDDLTFNMSTVGFLSQKYNMAPLLV